MAESQRTRRQKHPCPIVKEPTGFLLSPHAVPLQSVFGVVLSAGALSSSTQKGILCSTFSWKSTALCVQVKRGQAAYTCWRDTKTQGCAPWGKKRKEKKKDAYSHASPKALEGGSKVPQIGLPRLDSQAKRDTPEKVHRNKSLKRGAMWGPLRSLLPGQETFQNSAWERSAHAGTRWMAGCLWKEFQITATLQV